MTPLDGWGAHATAMRRYAQGLDDAAVATATVVVALAIAWSDATGREWAERLRLVGRELDRCARAALDQADAADGLAAGGPAADGGADGGGAVGGGAVGGGAVGGGAVGGGAVGGRWPGGPTDPASEGVAGITLGAQTGAGATRRRGVVVPTLPAPPG